MSIKVLLRQCFRKDVCGVVLATDSACRNEAVRDRLANVIVAEVNVLRSLVVLRIFRET